MKVHLAGNDYDLNDKIKAYVQEKIGGLDRFLPRDSRQAQASVILTLDPSGREGNRCVCEAQIKAPHAVFTAKEATVNMFAAVDIVEAKLKSQVLKHKEKSSGRTDRRRWYRRFIGRQ